MSAVPLFSSAYGAACYHAILSNRHTEGCSRVLRCGGCLFICCVLHIASSTEQKDSMQHMPA